MQKFRKRFLSALAIKVIAGAGGAAIGYLLGRVATLKIMDYRISVDTGSVVIAGCALAGCALGLIWTVLHRRNFSMEQQLRRAIAKGRLQVVYQPIVNLCSEQIIGAEALARWTDDEGHAVSPEVFIHIAEERGFVNEIMRLVMERSLNDFREIFSLRPEFRLSVNVAAADLSDPKLLPFLDSALERSGVPRKNLAIEITETTAARGEAAIETIRRLRRAGHQVHIDDFGTGYSSLSYLSDLSVDAIKIDRAFTQAIGTDSATLAILPQILAMAKALELQVIVEGIENVRQAVYFSNCERAVYGQGWLYGRPVPLPEFRLMLAARQIGHRENLPTEDEAAYALPANAG
ncbi:MAG: EAL domain-containing protein [Terracidiphilus sp.]